MRYFSTILWAGIVATLAAPLGATEIDAFIERIHSDDDAVRMTARNEAPQHGPAAVVPLARVMQGDHREGAITARHALTKIVHHAGRPGGEAAAKAKVCAEVAKLTRPPHSDYVRREALHWLGLIGGDSDVAVVERCVGDSGRQIDEAARLALERIPGKAAVAALQRAADTAAPARRPDYLFSLGKKADLGAVPFLLKHAASKDDEIAFAAFQALAHLGAPGAEKPLAARIAEEADEASRAKLWGEQLRLADELRRRGEEAAFVRLYDAALREATFDYQRERALLRLASLGGPALVDRLLVGLVDASARVRGRAIEWLERLEGPEVFASLAEGFEGAGPRARAAVLRAMHLSDESRAASYVERSRTSDDPELRIVAFDLEEGFDPSLEADYLREAGEESSPIRAAAFRGYLRLAQSRLDGGDGDNALASFSRALDVGREASERESALSGLLACDDPRAVTTLSGLLADPVLSRPAADGLIRLAARIGETDVDAASRHLETIVGGAFPLEQVLRAADELKKLGRDPREPTLAKGFVLDWWLVGPIRDEGKAMETRYFPEDAIRLGQIERIGPRRFRWKKLQRLSLSGRVDLTLEFRRSQNVIAYAYTELESSEERDVVLKLGSDDGAILWLNDEVVSSKPGPRSYQADQDSVRVRLSKGTNRVLVKIGQGGGDWAFSLRVTDGNGQPLRLSK